MRIDLIDHTGLGGPGGHEDGEHLDDLIAREDESGIGGIGVELGQTLAQQCEKEALVKRQGPAGHEPQGRGLLDLRIDGGRPQECIPLCLINDDDEAEDADVIANLGLQGEQMPPGNLLIVAVDDPLHQLLGVVLFDGVGGVVGDDGGFSRGLLISRGRRRQADDDVLMRTARRVMLVHHAEPF